MSRSHELYLRDIVKAGERIQRFVAGLDSDAFKQDDLRVDGVLFNLMIIGEAIKSIPDETQQKYPEVRWRDISRFRDRIVHHYFKLDLNIVWEIVDVHLPVLIEQVEKLLEEASNEEDS
jgi:uncharacterized protein with HEPN domain